MASSCALATTALVLLCVFLVSTDATARRTPLTSGHHVPLEGMDVRHIHQLIAMSEAKPFIYIYDLPNIFNEGLFKFKHNFHGKALEADKEMHQYLMTHPARTLDPCQAEIYFIPIYNHYMVESDWFRGDLDFHVGDLWRSQEAGPCELGWCSYVDYANRAAINMIKTHFPFWNQSDGANHVAIFPTDGGRCDAIPLLLHNGTAGGLIALQSNGEFKRPFMPWGEHDWPQRNLTCHKVGHDIVFPGFVRNGSDVAPVHPNTRERDIAILARFHGADKSFFGVRQIMLDHMADLKKGIPYEFKGRIESDWAPSEQTHDEETRAVLCITPPGGASWTLRMVRSIMVGCIPVTQFDETEHGFESMGLDYSKFMVNFPVATAVNHTEQMFRDIEELLQQPQRIHELQQGVAAVQHLFNWDRAAKRGAQAAIVGSLKNAALRFGPYRAHRNVTCDVRAEVAAFKARADEANRELARFAAEQPVIRAQALFEAVLPEYVSPVHFMPHLGGPLD